MFMQFATTEAAHNFLDLIHESPEFTEVKIRWASCDYAAVKLVVLGCPKSKLPRLIAIAHIHHAELRGNAPQETKPDVHTTTLH